MIFSAQDKREAMQSDSRAAAFTRWEKAAGALDGWMATNVGA